VKWISNPIGQPVSDEAMPGNLAHQKVTLNPVPISPSSECSFVTPPLTVA
jgi:hypothetical protein